LDDVDAKALAQALEGKGDQGAFELDGAVLNARGAIMARKEAP